MWKENISLDFRKKIRWNNKYVLVKIKYYDLMSEKT